MKKVFTWFIVTTIALSFLFVPCPEVMELGSEQSSIFSITVSAAESWPSASQSSYVEFKAKSKINVYKNSDLSKRGTCNPSKAYDASISENDVCYIYDMNSSYFLTNYPTPSGRRTGYIRRSDVTSANAPNSCKIASGKALTYPYPGASSWGYVEKGDRVYHLAELGEFTQIIYSAKSDKREFKLGVMYTNDYNKICNGSSNQNQSKALSEALYKSKKAYISCGYDGYRNTSGRHEGIDFKYKLGSNIYSLTDGTVIRVASGSTGSGGLSTIAIYNSSYDKTVIYLHAAPSVKTGDKIRTGDKIGEESWRGISNKSSSHTHVEVRNGKKEYAAKSVGDSHLDNGNPSSFWKSLGYTIK